MATLYLQGQHSLSSIIGHLNCFQLFVIKKKCGDQLHTERSKHLANECYTQNFDWIVDYFFGIKSYK